MPRKPSKHRNPWKTADVKKLKKLSRKTTMRNAAEILNRTPGAVQQKAFAAGISFR